MRTLQDLGLLGGPYWYSRVGVPRGGRPTTYLLSVTPTYLYPRHLNIHTIKGR